MSGDKVTRISRYRGLALLTAIVAAVALLAIASVVVIKQLPSGPTGTLLIKANGDTCQVQISEGALIPRRVVTTVAISQKAVSINLPAGTYLGSYQCEAPGSDVAGYPLQVDSGKTTVFPVVQVYGDSPG